MLFSWKRKRKSVSPLYFVVTANQNLKKAKNSLGPRGYKKNRGCRQ